MEKLTHIILGGLHFLAAVAWIGGRIYNAFAVAPALKTLGDTKAQAMNMMAAKKFSWLTWTSVALLILTGIYQVADESDKLAPAKPAGTVLLVKLLLVAALIVILFIQVYVQGPRMKRLLEPATPKNQKNQLG